jgi:hypothetical protein
MCGVGKQKEQEERMEEVVTVRAAREPHVHAMTFVTPSWLLEEAQKEKGGWGEEEEEEEEEDSYTPVNTKHGGLNHLILFGPPVSPFLIWSNMMGMPCT